MTSITVTGVPTVKAPRGALWAAGAAAAAWAGLSRWLGAQRRAGAAADTPAIEAARVREMARRFAAVDPGFAADLMAAADRHEAQHGVR
jgi:hypothetical protein